jgi:hypothetical protein
MTSLSAGDDHQYPLLEAALQARHQDTCFSYVLPLLVILNVLTLVIAFFSWMA